jgi:chorismate-pyruvate lyase
VSGFLAQTGLVGLGDLSLLQRMLLVCDGTLTDMVEAAFLEPIRLVKIAIETEPAGQPVEELELAAGALVMRRQILLRGATTGTNYVYAESLIAVDALPPALRDALLETDAPLGRLWVQHQLETRKEILQIWRIPAEEESPWFGAAAAQGQLGRQYRVFSGGKPIMLIAEYFPLTSTELAHLAGV